MVRARLAKEFSDLDHQGFFCFPMGYVATAGDQQGGCHRFNSSNNGLHLGCAAIRIFSALNNKHRASNCRQELTRLS